MNNKTALIFGYNKYAKEITNNVADVYGNIKRYALDKSLTQNEKFLVEEFDLSDDWEIIGDSVSIEDTVAFCVLENSAENIFLTISLRASFKDLTIIALASNKESANKLKMAGANRVVPMVETTSNIITNMLEKPISHNVLEEILYKESSLKIEQIAVTCNSRFKDEQLSSIDWGRYHGILILSVMHKDMQSEFIYSSKAKHHVVQEGDILVVVGHEKDLQEFKESMGGETCQ